MKKQLLIKTLLMAVMLLGGANFAWADNVVVPTPVYFQDFEEASTTVGDEGSNFGITGATLTGSGAIQTGDALFGQYYQNMPGATVVTKNANFLTLTTGAFTTMQTAGVKTVTISFWINAFNSTLSTDWGSLFVAYGESGNTNHGYPYGFDIRNTLAVHTNVWRAFYHDNGSQNSSWLSKAESLAGSWHHVAVVYTEDRTDVEDVKLVVKEYVDGTLKQSFRLTNGWDDENIGNRAYSLLDDMGRLTEYCIGGNSSETWNDPDNQYAYDEIAIYDVALSEAQISQIRANKLNRTVTGTQVGNVDNSTDYLAATSSKITLKPGESYHYSFINYNTGGYYTDYSVKRINTWNNWMLPVYDSNDAIVIALRADNWEDQHHVGDAWGSNAGCSSNFNWTDFSGNVNGATVDMTVTFTADKKFTMSSTINTVDGSTWNYSYTNVYTDSPIDLTSNDYIKVALSVSRSWLDITSEGYSIVSGTITDAGWSTFASSYPLNLSTLTAAHTPTAYYASAASGSKVTMTSTTATVPAGEGLMIKGTAGETFTIDVAASGTAIGGNLLKGQTTTGTVDASNKGDNGKYHYVFGYVTETPSTYGFYNLADDTEVAAGKAYLETTTALTAGARISIVFEDETTGISLTENSELRTENAVYDLQGRRVAQPQKGLYIVNGKKVIK